MDVRRSAAAKANICNLCDDLMMDILSRLPLKPLAICKCVSKSWRRLVSTLIHSPTRPRQITGLFIRLMHPHMTHGSIDYRHRGDGENNVDESLSFLPSHPYTRILDCRDGFLLSSPLKLYYRDNCNYCVCNPLTRQWVLLPLPPVRNGVCPNAVLVLDESSDFGCSHYKVVRFSLLLPIYLRKGVDIIVSSEFKNSLPHLYVDVYSSRTGNWAESKAVLKNDQFSLTMRPPVVLDGVVFLLTLDFRAVVYNVKEECCKMVDLVTYLGIPKPQGDYSNCFGEYEGCSYYAKTDGSRMEVWMLEDSTSGWVLKHNINLLDIGFPDPSAGSGYVWRVHLLAFHPNLHVIFIMKKFDLCCYNFDTESLETIWSWDPSPDRFMRNGALVYPFSECICPLPDAQFK